MSESTSMEMTWYGRTCVRLRGRDAVVVADPYQSVVGPTGRGITGDVVRYAHDGGSDVDRHPFGYEQFPDGPGHCDDSGRLNHHDILGGPGGR